MKEKLKILNDFVFIVGIESESEVNKFIFAATPKDFGDDEGSQWGGQIGAIKKSVVTNLKDQRNHFNKKISILESEILNSTSKVSKLEVKINNLQGA